MITSTARALAKLLTLAAMMAAIAVPAHAQTVYRFAPVNQYGINLTAAYWNPIIAYVSEKSGVQLSLKIGRTSADTIAYVLAKEVEFTFSNQLFGPEREKLGWKVFGSRRIPPINGQIVVPAESPITSVAELAGQPVAFPGPEAFVGYKLPYAHLLSKKIDVTVIFAGNHDGAFEQLASGRVKAVGAVSQLATGYSSRTGKKLRVLWSSEPMHELALMVSPLVPEKDARLVAEAFLGMGKDPRGREIIRKVSELVKLPENADFVPSTANDYGSYRRFYETAPESLR